MTIKLLRERCAYWQKRFQLLDWNIYLQWGSAREMKDLCGTCSWSVEDGIAVIKLNRTMPNQEETVIHELIHIVLQGHLPELPPYDVHLERGINRMAAAFMNSDGSVE